MPDAVPPGIIEQLADRSAVLPVPLEAVWYAAAHAPGRVFTLVWNHRWEFDKAPDRLFAALLKLKAAGVEFRVHVVGQQFRRQPATFADHYQQLADNIGQWGYVEDAAAYRQLLNESHVVLSTALHEFQGLAVLEAAACGCFPLVPDRLSYPELFPKDCRYPSYPDDPARESEALADALLALYEQFRVQALPAAPQLSSLSWAELGQTYRAEVESIVERRINT